MKKMLFAKIIKEKIGWNGEFELDISKPDGVYEKKVDGYLGETKLGWKPKTNLDELISEMVNLEHRTWRSLGGIWVRF